MCDTVVVHCTSKHFAHAVCLMHHRSAGSGWFQAQTQKGWTRAINGSILVEQHEGT